MYQVAYLKEEENEAEIEIDDETQNKLTFCLNNLT